MTDEEYARWERGNIRGLGQRRYFVRTEKDADGNPVNVYQLDDSDEWGPALPVDESNAQFVFHLSHHRTLYDPACPFCNARRLP